MVQIAWVALSEDLILWESICTTILLQLPLVKIRGQLWKTRDGLQHLGLKVSTSKSKALLLCKKTVDWHFWLRITTPNEEGLFHSEANVEREIDRQIGVASAVMQMLYCIVLLKRELNLKVKFTGPSTYQPSRSCALGNERMRSQIPATKIIFLQGWQCSPLEVVWGA